MKLQYKASLLIFAFGSICLITISLIYYFLTSASDLKSLHVVFQETVKGGAEHVNIILDEKANEAVILSSAPIVIESLTRSNAKYASMAEDEKRIIISELNDRWMKTKDVSDPFIQSYMTNPSARFFEEYSERSSAEYGEIFLTNRYGVLVATTQKLTTLSHAHKYWWEAGYAGGKGRIFFDDRGFDTSVGAYVLGVVVPVMKDGEVIGMLKSNININGMLKRVVESFHHEGTSNLKIIRSRGEILLEKNKEPLSTKAPLSLVEKMRTRTAGSFVFEGPEKSTINAYTPVQITLGSSEYGFGGKSESIDHIRGNKGELWFVVMSQGLEEALAPSYRRMKELVSIGALLITLIGILAIFLGNRVALPVILMEKSIKRIGDGDFDVKIDIHSDEQLGKLEESFNKMAKNLKDTTTSRDKLQAEVKSRRQAEKTLKEERNKLSAIIEAVEYGMTIQNPDYDIIYQNKQMSDTFGNLGGKCYKVYEGKDSVCDGCPLEMAFKDGKSHTSERKVEMPSGETAFWENTASPIRDADGTIVACLEIARNITQRKRSEEVLKESEKRFQDIAENTGDWIWESNNEGRYTYSNKTVEKVMGYKPEEIIGKYFYDFLLPEERDLITTNVFKAYSLKKPFTNVLNRKINKDGHIIITETNGIPILDEDGNLIGYRGAVRDITERKQIEERVLESEMRFRSVTQSASDAIISADSGGKIISWNNGAQKIFGYGEEEMLGKPLTALMPERYRHEHIKGFNLAISNGTNKIIGKTIEFNGLKIDGSEFPMELSIAIWGTDKGKFFSAIIRDISERKILQQQLIQSEKLSSIGTFISGIAHEINNPLGVILGYSQLLSDYARLSKNDIKDYVDIIIKQSKKTATIVKSLLKYTRKGNQEKTPVNINTVLEETVNFQIIHFKSENIEIKSDYDTNLNLVNADKSELQQVFTNIIINAIDSLKQTDIKGNITIRTEQTNKEVVVAIENEGPPIPEDMLSKIFDPFFTTKDVGEGTGLGLYISSGIVQEHGGKLWVENIPDFGVRFVVTLPHTEKKTSPVEVSIGPKVPKNLKVLFVDDEEPMRKLVKDCLAKERCVLAISREWK